MSSDTERTKWFVEEVQPHEPLLRSYLRGMFPSARDVDDILQESYVRIWRARTTNPIQSAKAFLFRVARNLAFDVVRDNRSSPVVPMGSLVDLPVIDDRPSASESLTRQEKGDLLGMALAELPKRCREIVFLHKIKGLSQREVANRMGLSEKTVANQIGLGVRKCEEFVRRRGAEFF